MASLVKMFKQVISSFVSILNWSTGLSWLVSQSTKNQNHNDGVDEGEDENDEENESP